MSIYIPALSAADRRARDQQIVAAYQAGQSQAAIAADHRVTVRTVGNVVFRYGVTRPRGRPRVWPDCPPALEGEFRSLQRYVGAAEARATLERSLAL